MDIDLGAVERELCRIPDVRAARIVLDHDGEPAEVHVLATPGKHAKQLVRDVQSVALAASGIEIDHRIVSVVQLDDLPTPAAGEAPAPPAPPQPAAQPAAEPAAPPVSQPAGSSAEPAAQAVEPDSGGAPTSDSHTSGGEVVTAERRAAPAPAATPARPATDPAAAVADNRIVVDGVIALRRGFSCTAEVTLRRGEEVVSGSSEGSAAASAALRLVAEATVDAICQLVPDASHIHVETAATTRVGDRSVALVTLVLVVPPNEEVVTGSAPVRPAGEHDAIARAVLDATNRRIARSR